MSEERSSNTPSPAPRIRSGLPAGHWWVNHEARALRHELEGSYLWCPKRNPNGTRNASFDNMSRALPADLVFSHAEGRIGALGMVLDRVRTAPAPAHRPQLPEHAPHAEGWFLPVRFEALAQPLTPRTYMKRLAPVLPPRYAPLRVNGEGRQSVYLAEVPPAMAEVLCELLAGQVQKIEEQIAIETDDQLTDSAIEERIWRRSDLGPLEKRQLVNARIGQGVFRQNVERFETFCRVTGVADRRHLRARHIKPWRLADDREKLDGCNGLLLSPHIDHLLDRGHVSFADDGRLLISRHLNPSVARAWGFDRARPPYAFRPEQCRYLDFHRRNVFETVHAGRRT
ncbi:MAG TPA: HNH endonuclease [Steroidobacteraceae bacterium]|nr:HNH endonuclease [Steroidobacteraceae bacterium]